MPPMLSRRHLLRAAPLLACPGLSRADPAFDPEADPTFGRQIVFDEFFTAIDPAIWHAGRKATTFDGGYYGRSAFAPIEGAEGVVPYAIVDDPEAENGHALRLSAYHIGRPMTMPDYYGNEDPEFQWVSGNLQTARSDGTILRGWRRGYFETRMRMPLHPLTWSAFWMMNGNSILTPRTSIEIDVIEHKGFEPHLYGAYLHEWGQPGEHHEGAGVPVEPDLSRGYHRYGVLLTRNRCQVYFDRRPIRAPFTGKPLVWVINRSVEMDMDNDTFWPLLTLALLSDVSYPDPLRDQDREAHLHIDYFRVFA
ncbi:glycoside hydrolase family 16 protein [Paenirhodobacter sp.]|uniref:glycoside hydrolase family 16 protein n=1 Tax=Paenirhodobacter sp. TaxID=1965326 RepID=UPI003B421B1F